MPAKSLRIWGVSKILLSEVRVYLDEVMGFLAVLAIQ
jgi:hypothetical protein